MTTPIAIITQPVRESVSAIVPVAITASAYQTTRSLASLLEIAIAKESSAEAERKIEKGIGCPHEVTARVEPKRASWLPQMLNSVELKSRLKKGLEPPSASEKAIGARIAVTMPNEVARTLVGDSTSARRRRAAKYGPAHMKTSWT
jgi:hypothetical protein